VPKRFPFDMSREYMERVKHLEQQRPGIDWGDIPPQNRSATILVRLIEGFLGDADPEFYLRFKVGYSSSFPEESWRALRELRRKMAELAEKGQVPSEDDIYRKADEIALLPAAEIPSALTRYRAYPEDTSGEGR
jgi:hypothetical protein